MITRQDLDKFKAIFKKEFGITLSDDEATAKATNLLNAMREVIKPVRDYSVSGIDLKKS